MFFFFLRKVNLKRASLLFQETIVGVEEAVVLELGVG